MFGSEDRLTPCWATLSIGVTLPPRHTASDLKRLALAMLRMTDAGVYLEARGAPTPRGAFNEAIHNDAPMMAGIATVGVWLQQTVTRPDTLLMKQVGSTPSTFEQVTSVASGLMSIALLVFVVAAVPAAWNFRKSYKKANDLLKRIYGDVTPLMRHASTIADNIDYITTSIRTDVQQVNETIASANERLRTAMSVTERR